MNQRTDHSRRPCYSQNKEHRKICNDCTVQINPDATTLWRVIGFAVPDLMTGPVDLFVSESGKSFMLPKKVKTSSQNNLIPFTGCCMREGYWISASVSSAFSCCYHAVSSSFSFLCCPLLIYFQILLLLSFHPPSTAASHLSSYRCFVPFFGPFFLVEIQRA